MILSALLALCQPAHAIDVKWWGVGPTVGTVAIPAKYPIGLPQIAQNGDTDKVQRVGGDIDFGVHAVMYPSASFRLGARGLVGLGLGSPWSSGQLTVEGDYAFVKESGFQLLFGGGIGAGTERFGGTEALPDGYLVVNYFPIRAQLSALLRDKTRAYSIDIFGAYHIAADQTYFKSESADGTVPEGLTDGAALYAKLGIEATVYFGDFKNDKSQKGGSRGGGKKKNR